MLNAPGLCCSVVLSCLTSWFPDSNLGLCLIHSSNGKSVSWSESGPRHPPKGGNVWHRLSVHVRKQEAGLNQTAVIRPLTNTPDPHSCEPPTCDLGTDSHLPEEAPAAQKPLYNVAEEDGEDSVQRPLWAATCSGRLEKPDYILPSHSGCATEGLQGAVVDTHNSHVPSLNDHTAKESKAAKEPFSLTPSRPPLAPDERPEEELDLLHSYIYHTKGGEEEEEDGEEDGLLQNNKTGLVDSLALSPPSPFRDSVCSGDSVSGSPPSSVYTDDILRDFAHSSSTL